MIPKKILSQFAFFSVFLSFLALPLQAAEHQHQHGKTEPSAGKPSMEEKWQKMRSKPQTAIAAAFNEKGELLLALVQEKHLIIQFSSDKGQSFHRSALVNKEPEEISADGENRPKIAFGKKGEIYVSYTVSLDKPFTGNVRFSRSTDGGKTFSTPITVNDNREMTGHRYDTILVDNKGMVYVAWLDKRDADEARAKGGQFLGSSLYYAVSEDQGKTFLPNKRAAEHTCECCRLAIAFDTDNVPLVFWRHIFGKNTRDHALIRLEENAQPLRITFDEWNIDACPHHGPSLAVDENGRRHLAWFSDGQTRSGLFYAYAERNATTTSTPLMLGNPLNMPSHPSLLVVGESVHLAWKEYDGAGTAIFAAVSRDGGNTFTQPRKVATASANSDNPFVITDGKGAYLYWNDDEKGFSLIDLSALPE